MFNIVDSKAKLLLLGLLLSVVSLFFSNNLIKFASLFFCLLYILLARKRIYKYQDSRLEVFLFIPVFVGFLFSWKNNTFNTFRDFIFFLIPLIYFMVGKRFSEQDGDIGNLIYFFSGVYCTIFLLILVFQWFDTGSVSVQLIRDFVSPGSFLLVLCIYFIFDRAKSWRAVIFRPMFLVSVSIFLMQASRTYFLVLLVFLLFRIMRKRYTKNVAYIAMSVLSLSMIAVLFGGYEFVSEFFEKLIFEISFTESWTMEDLGTRYRAYEAFSAYSTFISYAPFGMIFGGGLGSVVELGVPVLLSGTEYDTIPWIHNGYLFILIKTGIFGMICYFVFFAKMYATSRGRFVATSANLIKATVIGLIISNIVVCGFFSNESAFAYVILGFFSCSHPARTCLEDS